MRGHPQIEAEADDLRLPGEHFEMLQHAADVKPRTVLVAEEMQRSGEQPIGHHQVDGIGCPGHDAGEALGVLQGFTEFAIVELVDAQPPQRPQAMVAILEPVGELERRGPCRSRLARASDPVHQRPAERRRQLHAQAIRIHGGGIKPCHRPLDALAAFAQQRHLDPHRHGGRRQRNPGLRISIRRERPVETGAHIVDVAAIDREPFVLWHRFALGLGAREVDAIECGVTACGLLLFAAGAQLLQRVGPRGVEQAIMRGLAAQVGGEQRLRDQARDMIGGKIAGNGNHGFQREIAGEDRQPPQHRRFLVRQQVVAPVQRRAQGLMPRQRGATAGGQ